MSLGCRIAGLWITVDVEHAIRAALPGQLSGGAVMKGSVSSFETKHGRRWRTRFDRPPGCNADTSEVERRQTTRRGFRTRREAEQALREALAAVDHQRHVEIRKDALG